MGMAWMLRSHAGERETEFKATMKGGLAGSVIKAF